MAIDTIKGRQSTMIELFVSEWTMIGRMKKRLNKLIDNCRICEKKIRVYDLLEHSFFCEKRLKLKEESKPLIPIFLGYCDSIMEYIKEWLAAYNKANR